MVGTTLYLECEIRNESKFDVGWFKDTTAIVAGPKFSIKNNLNKCQLTMKDVCDADFAEGFDGCAEEALEDFVGDPLAVGFCVGSPDLDTDCGE